MYYHGNIEEITLKNTDYRRVLYTGQYMQLVVMNIKPSQEIGSEIHNGHDQFIRVEKGEGIAIFGENEVKELKDGISIVIPSGIKHNIINTGSEDLKLYTIYSPPEHKDRLVQQDKPQEKSNEYELIEITDKNMTNAQNVVALSNNDDMNGGGKKRVRVFKFKNLF
jgi:mannose-6-phosphate isomerase-like protein (cupin superfamily)